MLTSNALAPASHRPLSRRSFLGSAGASLGALVVGTTISFRGDDAQAATMSDAPMPNAFIRRARHNLVTVIIKHLDKGQGVSTGLTTIVADELDADWGQMRSVF